MSAEVLWLSKNKDSSSIMARVIIIKQECLQTLSMWEAEQVSCWRPGAGRGSGPGGGGRRALCREAALLCSPGCYAGQWTCSPCLELLRSQKSTFSGNLLVCKSELKSRPVVREQDWLSRGLLSYTNFRRPAKASNGGNGPRTWRYCCPKKHPPETNMARVAVSVLLIKESIKQ